MTGEQIIKALTCCMKDDCGNCPMLSKDWERDCANDLMGETLNYISRLKTANNYWQQETKKLWVDNCNKKEAEDAIKEFADRVKENIDCLVEGF